jgi:hypothetical protein
VKELNGSYTPMTLRIYRNDNENYSPMEIIPNPWGEGWVDFTAATWADYDSDGDMDILLAGHYNSGSEIEGRARIYTNDNGIFTDSGNELPAPHASGDHGGTFSWLDIDADGDLDYFIAGEYFVPGGNGLVEAQMHLYRNDTPGQNEAPLIPTGLLVTQESDSAVLLSWNEGSDDHTPANSLTYDLNLFKNNIPVVLPTHTPDPGNVSAVTEWSLTGLEPGNYTWTLSTIDAAYIASPVATGEFNLGATSIGEMSESSLSGYHLGQNYPNPSSHLTTIRYIIPQEGKVSLRVFNIRGEEVATLVSQNRQAGNYEIILDASGLPDGVYYYRLLSGDVSLSRKLMVSKGFVSY